MVESVDICPNCKLAVSPEARFCSNCGARLDDGPAEPGAISYSRPEPKLFGVLNPTPTFVLACIVLAASLVAFFTGGPVLGVILLAVAAALFVLFYGAAERNHESGLAKAAVDGVARVSGWWRFSHESASAWTGAGQTVVRLKRELRPLRSERKDVQLALGQAAYEQNEERVAALRATLADLDHAIAERERESAEVVARARHRVDDERVAVQPTEQMAPDAPTEEAAQVEEADAPVEEERKAS